MKSKNQVKETNIKYCVYCYFVTIINSPKINFSNNLLDKNVYGNISICNILCKNLMGPKSFSC